MAPPSLARTSPWAHSPSTTCYECQCCAYGGLSAIPLAVAPLAVIFSWSFTFTCHFWQTTVDAYPYDLGLWSMERFSAKDVEAYPSTGQTKTYSEFEDECVYLADHDYLQVSDSDAPFQFARSMSLLVCLLGALVMNLLFGLACCQCHPLWIRSFMITQIMFGLMTLLVLVRFVFVSADSTQRTSSALFGLRGPISLSHTYFCASPYVRTLLAQTSRASDFCEEDCHLSGGGKVCVLTAILWFGSGASLLILKPKQRHAQSTHNGQGGGAALEMVVPAAAAPPAVYRPDGSNVPSVTPVSTTNHVQPDGSIVQVTTTTHAFFRPPTTAHTGPMAAAAAASPGDHGHGLPIATAVPLKDVEKAATA